MDLCVRWHKPIKLRKSKAGSTSIYELNLDDVSVKPGVYVFMRKFGNSLRPLYVGKAQNLKTRIGQQLNSLNLMKGIQNSAIGNRFLVVGEFIPKPGQTTETCITLVEKALISHFLSEGNNLLNVAGTKIPTSHSVTSKKVTRNFIPHTILF